MVGPESLSCLVLAGNLMLIRASSIRSSELTKQGLLHASFPLLSGFSCIIRDTLPKKIVQPTMQVLMTVLSLTGAYLRMCGHGC